MENDQNEVLVKRPVCNYGMPEKADFLHWIDTKTDEEIDQILGIRSVTRESDIRFGNLRSADEDEELWENGAKWTPYRTIREIASKVDFQTDEEIHDLGCGYGRVCIGLGLLTNNQIHGVELVPTRAVTAAQAVRVLDMNHVHIRCGNIRNYAFRGDATYILFNPFSTPTLNFVLDQITLLAQTNTARVITIGDNITYRYLKKRENFKMIQSYESEDKVVWSEFRCV